ncbi:MAG: protein kinase [Pirellulaceae bacterium]|nr:protein kinase [Pirellulaceae bacterium]
MDNPSFKNPAYEALTNQQLIEIDALGDRFDQELLKGDAPRMEDFLTDAPEAVRDELLAELLAMELEYRSQQSENPQPDDYLQRFPQQHRLVAAVFENLAKRTVPTSARMARVGDANFAPTDVPPNLDNFQLIEVIGRGGMGVVWRADQLRPVKRRVALKLIKSEFQSRDVLARFDAEKQTLAMMDHPNIARVLDAGTTPDGRPYFVMELVDGIPITQYCDEKKLSVDERLKLFVAVCHAVQHAHQKGIIHRDLKPSNVLVADIDGEAVPKVIDFGLAKAVDQRLSLTDMTMETEYGKVVGTVRYMSPEQAGLERTDAANIDTRTDIYSLGVMLYELLTGSTPLDKEQLGKIALLGMLKTIREEDPPRPSSRLRSSSPGINSAVSDLRRLHPARLRQILKGELDWVVMKALEKDRSRRYQTANDFAKDLSNFLTGEAVTARPPSTWYQIQKFSRKNRGLVAALFAIAAVLLIGIAGTTYGMFQAIQKTKLAEYKTDEARTERGKAEVSKRVAVLEKANAESNERRAVKAEEIASGEAQRLRDSEAAAKFQLAVARYDANRAVEARTLLHQIPTEYRDNFEWHYCNRKFQGSDVTCMGHTGPVYEVAFTPDGTRVVSTDESGTIRIWDAAIGQELGKLKSHDGRIDGLAVSPDGSLIASAGSDATVRLWDAKSGDIIHTISGHLGAINGLAFSPSGDGIASASVDQTVKVWDPKSGAEIFTLTGHTASVVGVAFSPDGKQLASTSSGDRTLRIWDSGTGEQIKVVQHSYPEVRRLAFSPDGTRLAGVTYSVCMLWDTQTWEHVGEVSRHNRIVRCVAFSPDGTQLATAGDSTEIKIWDTRTGNLINTLSGHAKTIWAVAFSPDGRRLVSGCRDGTVRIWNTHGDNDLTLSGHSGFVHCVAFSLDGRQLASGSESVILRDAQTGDVKFRLNRHTAKVNGLFFSPNGTRLASASDDNTVRLWNTETGEEVAVLKGHTGRVTGVAYSPDGNRLVSSSRDGTIKLWDVHAHEETATLNGNQGTVYGVAYSPDGSCFASAGYDNTVKLWDVETGSEIRTFTGHTGLVRTLAFDQTGKRLVSGVYDTKIRVWDVVSGKQIATAHASSGAVFGVAFSPDGNRFAACGTDHSVHLFESSSGQEFMTFFPGKDGVESVAFSPDGTRLAAAVAGMGNIRIWDAPHHSESEILSGHSDTVSSVTFSQDGSRIYSESENEKLVWNVATRETIPDAMWAPSEVLTHTCPDGRWFVTTESNNVVLVDLEYKNTPDEKARRKTKASFDSFWHQKQATDAITAENWFAAVFHYGWLLQHDPDSLEYYVGLRSSYRRLTAQTTDVATLSRINNVIGENHGTFYSQDVPQVVTSLPAKSFMASGDSNEPTTTLESNHAIYFAGSSYGELGSLPFYKASFTVEGWFKSVVSKGSLVRSPSLPYAVFSLRSGDLPALVTEVQQDGRFRVVHRNPPGTAGGIDLRSQTHVTDGQWHHFTVVRDNDRKLHLYIDGSLEASSEDTVPDFGDATLAAFLGVNTNQAPRYFSGSMDEVRCWNVARTIEDIQRDRNRPVDPSSEGLIAYYDFNQIHETSNLEATVEKLGQQELHFAPVVRESLQLPPPID